MKIINRYYMVFISLAFLASIFTDTLNSGKLFAYFHIAHSFAAVMSFLVIWSLITVRKLLRMNLLMIMSLLVTMLVVAGFIAMYTNEIKMIKDAPEWLFWSSSIPMLFNGVVCVVIILKSEGSK